MGADAKPPCLGTGKGFILVKCFGPGNRYVGGDSSANAHLGRAGATVNFKYSRKRRSATFDVSLRYGTGTNARVKNNSLTHMCSHLTEREVLYRLEL
jgi:hypothetical protein